MIQYIIYISYTLCYTISKDQEMMAHLRSLKVKIASFLHTSCGAVYIWKSLMIAPSVMGDFHIYLLIVSSTYLLYPIYKIKGQKVGKK